MTGRLCVRWHIHALAIGRDAYRVVIQGLRASLRSLLRPGMTRFGSLRLIASVCADYPKRTLIALPDKLAIQNHCVEEPGQLHESFLRCKSPSGCNL
ncbi:hypothetical protein MPLDJ20_20814 [Mesorhizobium plurifarium]|uniref:Uncharacterized protein n=1 Tax=Mesorhizobium plurifarium TaxID=69974 RepID=A0A090F058_MESPL|nr:hypothetical protein MPLDJ20_20814 [Mesorhizobium plurifarium]